MGKRLESVGGVITGAYLLLIVSFVATRFNEFTSLKLNELGDFLAGSFGPIAFLWLVLGFLQQGRELKLSTDALKLQAEELKNSVEQQSIMAAAATQQIESQRMSLDLQRIEFERSVSPVLRFEQGSRGGGEVGRPVRSVSRLVNTGQEVSDLLVVFDPEIGGNKQFVIPIVGMKTSHDLPFDFDWPNENLGGRCLLSYMRSDGKHISEEFVYSIATENPFVRIDRVTAQLAAN